MTTSPLQVALDVTVVEASPPIVVIQFTPLAPEVAVTVAEASFTSPALEPNDRKPKYDSPYSKAIYLIS
jgi:hypothetical protein